MLKPSFVPGLQRFKGLFLLYLNGSKYDEVLAEGLSLDYFLESFPSLGREQAVGVLRYGQRRIEKELAWKSC